MGDTAGHMVLSELTINESSWDRQRFQLDWLVYRPYSRTDPADAALGGLPIRWPGFSITKSQGRSWKIVQTRLIGQIAPSLQGYECTLLLRDEEPEPGVRKRIPPNEPPFASVKAS